MTDIFDRKLDKVDLAGFNPEQPAQPEAPKPDPRQTLYGARTLDHDKEAEAQRLAREAGVTVDAARDLGHEIKLDRKFQTIDFSKLEKDSPAAAAWLSDQRNADIAADDVGPLTNLEAGFKAPVAKTTGEVAGNSYTRGTLTLRQILPTANIMANQGQTNVMAEAERMLAEGASKDQIRIRLGLQGAEFAALPPEERQKRMLVQGMQAGAQTAQDLDRIRILEDLKKNYPMGADMQRIMASDSFLEQIGIALTNPLDVGLDIGVESAVAGAPGVLAAPFLGPAAIGAGSAMASAPSAFLESLKRQGVDVTDRDALQAATLDRGIMTKAVEDTVGYTGSIGVLDFVSGGLAGRFAPFGRKFSDIATREVGTITSRGQKVANAGVEFGVQGALGAGGEGMGQLATGQELDPTAMLLEFLGEGLVGGPTEGAAMALNEIQVRRDAAKRAASAEAFLTDLNERAKATKVLQRDPDALAGLINDMAEKGGAPNKVFIDAGDLNDLLLQSNMTVSDFADMLPEDTGAKVIDAVMTGGTVEIPIGEHLTRVMETDIGKALMPHVRLEEDGYSVEQAKQFMAEYEERTSTEAEKILRGYAEDSDFRKSASEIRAQVERELLADPVAKMSPEQARKNARLTEAFYVTAARDWGNGMTPGELFKRVMGDRPVVTPYTGTNAGGQVIEQVNAEATFGEGDASTKISATRDADGTYTVTTSFNQSLMGGDISPQSNKTNGVIANSAAEAINKYRQERIAELERAVADSERKLQKAKEARPELVDDFQRALDIATAQLAEIQKDPTSAPGILEQRNKEQPAGRKVPESVDAQANVESSFEFAATRPFKTNREFKIAIQDRVNAAAKQARVDLTEFSKAVEEYLVRIAIADGRTALRTNANAIGWYNEKVTKALRLVSLIHPEISTDPQAKFAFVWALAVTSNGLKVDKNFELAEQAYEGWKNSGGVMPTGIGIGTAGEAIDDGLALYNTLIQKHGFDVVEKFMTTMQPAGDVSKFTGENVSGENKTTLVYGAAALGPKIGNGFFMNLYGHFEQLTMDRWLMRTWGRWTGTLVTVNMEQVKIKRERLKALIKALSPADKKAFEAILKRKLTLGEIDQVAVAIKKASAKKKNRVAMALLGVFDDAGAAKVSEIMGAAKKGQERVSFGDEIRKLGNGLAGELDGQKEAPSGPPERRNIRKVFGRVLATLKEEFPNLTMSDYQALLWYPEKRLYDAAKTADDTDEGYNDDEAPDYANAAAKLARSKGIADSDIAAVIAAVDAELQADVGAGAVRPGEGGQGAGGDGQANVQADGLTPEGKVSFEVAPDPNDAALTAEWDALPPADRYEISRAVAGEIVPQVLAEVGVAGDVLDQVGGYLGATNPSMVVRLPDPGQAIAVAKLLGHALSQDSMMVVTDTPADGTEPRGVVTIALPEGYGFAEIEELYSRLWELTDEAGERLVGGHSTGDGLMAILNFSSLSDEELAAKIDEHLWGEFVVDMGRANVAFIGKEDYGYAGDRLEGQAAAAQSPAPQRGDSIRQAATAALRRELDQRKAAGQQGEVAPGENLYQGQSAPVFYSALERGLQSVKTEKAPAAQWSAILAKLPGVKKDEIEAVDLPEFLAAQEGSVTKQQILDFVRANGVRVEEVVKGDDKQIDRIAEKYGYTVEMEYGEAMFLDSEGEEVAVWDLPDEMQNEINNAGDPTAKYSDLQLPGGKNYRELLLTLPRREPPKGLSWDKQQSPDADGYIWSARLPEGNVVRIRKLSDGYAGELDGMELFSGKATAEEAAAETERQLKDEVGYSAPGEMSSYTGDYRSGHWEEKNVVAHIRFNERTGANGERILHLEEIQSDWHQGGRKQGYLGGKTRWQALQEKGYYVKQDGAFWMVYDKNGDPVGEGSTKEEAINEFVFRDSENITPVGALNEAGVPDAPFKETPAWSMLAMKRMIRYAVDNGFDAVTWTGGEAQALRYKEEDQVAMEKRRKGMVGFYDKILPTETGKLVKKFGSKVEKVAVGSVKAIEIDKKSIEESAVEYMNNDIDAAELISENGLEGLVTEQQVDDALGGINRNHGKKIIRQFARDFAKEIANRAAGAKAGDFDGFRITDAMREQVAQGQALFQDKGNNDIPRGTFNTRTLAISLTEENNYSTFIHESGHAFLDITMILARMPDAPVAVRQRAESILGWLGIESTPEMSAMDVWLTMGLEQKRPHHERWAETFEQYTMTGKAPSLDLADAFDVFRDWMLRVYQSVKEFIRRNKLADLDDEVAAIFDRMLATDEQIAEAKAARAVVPLFTSKPASMTVEQWRDYQEQVAKQDRHDRHVIDRKKFSDMKWLRTKAGKVLRALQRDVKDKREAMKIRAKAAVLSQPAYRARQLLTAKLDPNGVPVGEDGLPMAARFNRSEFKRRFPNIEVGTSQLRGMFSDEGMPMDMIAEMTGFKTAGDLVAALLDTKPIGEAIEEMTDRLMLEKYGDITSPEAMQQAVDEAISGQTRVRFLASEIAIAARRIGSESAIAKAATDAARRIVDTLKVRDINPRTYRLAATRASREAMKALKAGNDDLVVKNKRTEILNTSLFDNATKTRAEISKRLAGFRKILRAKNEDLAKSRNIDMVGIARAVLAERGIGSDSTNKSAEAYYITMLQYDPDAAASIQSMLDMLPEVKNYKDMTVAEFRAMADIVDGIFRMARNHKSLQIAGDRIELDKVATELTDRIKELNGGQIPKNPLLKQTANRFQKFVAGFRGMKAMMVRVEAWCDMMGPQFTKYIFQPVSQAITAHRNYRAGYLKKYMEILKEHEKNLTFDPIKADEMDGFVFTGGKLELLHAILHTGNASNKRKLLLGRTDEATGRGWAIVTDAGVDTSPWDNFIRRMEDEGVITKEDYDFCQKVWDLMDEMKPDSQKAHYEMYGYYFDEITADPVVTRFGTYRGGYVPAIADRTDPSVAPKVEAEELLHAGNSFMFPTTGRGFTKGRVEYNKPLELDLRTIGTHIDKVSRFVNIEPRLREVVRLVQREDVAAAINATTENGVNGMLIPWLQRSARQTVSKPGMHRTVDQFWNYLRRTAGASTMAGNVVNVLQQLTGLSVAAIKVPAPYLNRALWNFKSSPKATVADIIKKSPFMRDRMLNQSMEMQAQIDKIMIGPGLVGEAEKAREFVLNNAYFLQQAVQNLVDPVVWMGAYDYALANGVEPEQAILDADAAVRLTQGSFAPEDIASFEANTPFVRIFFQFAGYFSMLANLMGSEAVKAMREASYARRSTRLTYIWFMGMSIPAVLAEAIASGLPDDEDDEDGDGTLDEWLAFFFKPQASQVAAMVPVAGAVATSVVSQFDELPYNDRFNVSPVLSWANRAVTGVRASTDVAADVADAVAEDQAVVDAVSKRDVKDALTLISLVTGLPTGQLGKTGGYALDIQQGNVAPESTTDLMLGLARGR